MKTCTKCSRTLPTDSFGRVRRAPDGLNWWCRQCMADAARASYYRRHEESKVRARESMWLRHQDPAVREAKRAADRAAYRRNPVAYKARAADRRARQAAAPVNHYTERDWQRQVARQRGCCHFCGQSSDRLQREHLIPLSRGGAHSAGNIVAACAGCNFQKHTRTPMEYRVWLLRKAAVA